LDPALLAAYTLLGQVYVRERKLDAALAEFDAIARQNPKSVVALTTAGIILQMQDKIPEARDRYERAVAADPTAAVAANNLAWLHAETGNNLDLALDLAQRAYRVMPDSAEVCDTLGFIYYKRNLLPQAIRVLREAVEKNPPNPAYHYHLGLALGKAGDAGAARAQFERALALDANYQGARDELRRTEAQ
jgi:tetratricopeptide (TPR) repeat protein